MAKRDAVDELVERVESLERQMKSLRIVNQRSSSFKIELTHPITRDQLRSRQDKLVRDILKRRKVKR